MRNTHLEQMFSALQPKADSSQASRHGFGPIGDIAGFACMKEAANLRRPEPRARLTY
jgi:hypothetical protein